MSEHCNDCETSMVGATLADGTSLCPNCLVMLAVGISDGDVEAPVEKDVEAGSGLECAACGALKNAAMVNDFCVDDPNRRTVKWPACAECLRETAMLNLTPMKVKNLRAYAEGELFNTHGDFYDEFGNAEQPRGGDIRGLLERHGWAFWRAGPDGEWWASGRGRLGQA